MVPPVGGFNLASLLLVGGFSNPTAGVARGRVSSSLYSPVFRGQCCSKQVPLGTRHSPLATRHSPRIAHLTTGDRAPRRSACSEMRVHVKKPSAQHNAGHRVSWGSMPSESDALYVCGRQYADHVRTIPPIYTTIQVQFAVLTENPIIESNDSVSPRFCGLHLRPRHSKITRSGTFSHGV